MSETLDIPDFGDAQDTLRDCQLTEEDNHRRSELRKAAARVAFESDGVQSSLRYAVEKQVAQQAERQQQNNS